MVFLTTCCHPPPPYGPLHTKDKWSPALQGYFEMMFQCVAHIPPPSVGQVCLSLQQLLLSPDHSDPLDHKIAKVYKDTPELAEKTATEWTKRYAKG